MGDFKVGDIVTRKSYGGDVYFRIMQIVKKQEGQEIYILKGTNVRLIADSPERDLLKPSLNKIDENNDVFNKKINAAIKRALLQRRGGASGLRNPISIKPGNTESTGRSGKVLHIDGDQEYLNICLKGYKKLGIECLGKFVTESQQPNMVYSMLQEYKPDILVLTGHDGMVKGSQNLKSIDSYRNSKYYVEAVKRARDYEKSYDDLIIFAGACQSFYEAIIDSGANFASSPGRVLIHAMDPVMVCEKIAFGSIAKFISPKEVMESTITGSKGIGGIETRGKYREISPKLPYD